MDLIVPTAKGLFCPPGQFYIDPWQPVERAIITHGHSDHARRGMARYLCHTQSVAILQKRLGDVSVTGVEYRVETTVNGVTVSLHPAGHVLGSAQIRVEYRGEIWVASGDYKLEDDGTCAPFEPVRCHAFISESTFGLPIYQWRDPKLVHAEINAWWQANAAAGRASIMQAYGLGKAQRILKHLDPAIGPIICHGAVEPMNEVYRAAGVALPATHFATQIPDKAALARAFIIAPPSAAGSPWARRFGDYSDAFASGWMQIRGRRRQRGVDQGFVVSDHADWPGLLSAIAATNAERVFATHGSTATLSRYLREKGLDARPIETQYGEDDDDVVAETIAAP